MNNNIVIKPLKGAIVIKPDGKRLKAEGEVVRADDIYWHKRLSDGEIEIVKVRTTVKKGGK